MGKRDVRTDQVVGKDTREISSYPRLRIMHAANQCLRPGPTATAADLPGVCSSDGKEPFRKAVG